MAAADPLNLIASELIAAVLHSEIAPVSRLSKVKSSKVGGALIFSTANSEKVTEAQITQLVEACNARIKQDAASLAQLPAQPEGTAEAIQAEYKKLASRDASLGVLDAIFNKGLVDAPEGQQEFRFLVGQPAVKAFEATKAAEIRKANAPAVKPAAEPKINPNQLAKMEKMKGRGSQQANDRSDVFGNWGPRREPPQRQAAQLIFQEVIARELLPLLQQHQGAKSPEELVAELQARSMERLEEELVMFGNEFYTRGLSSVKNLRQPPLADLL